jgi:DNA repair protein RecO (recombination protein O)
MRAFSIAGWSPSLDSCGRCGSEFHLNAFVAHFGGLVCDGCAPSGSPRVTPSVVGAFNALLEGNWAALEQTDSRDLERTSGLISAFTQWHLERGLKSMEHVAR